MNPAQALAAAMRHHQAGQIAQAEQLYAQVLAAEPTNLQALVLSGALAHMAGRNTQAVELFARALALNEQPDLHYNIGLAHWALGQRGEAVRHWSRALALNPNFAQAHMNLGNALREDGRLAEALTHLRRALQLQPSPFAHNNLGLALSALGDAEAVAHYRHAIAMYPDFLEAHTNLAIELAAAGENDAALAHARRALQVKDSPEARDLFVRIAGTLDAVREDPALRQLVTRATAEQWGQTGELVPLVIALLRHGSSIEPLMARAEQGATGKDLVGSAELAVVAREPLLRWLVESAVVAAFAIERILTAARALLLDMAAARATADEALQRFACALARQCYINEYVFALTDEEAKQADQLAATIRTALDDNAAADPFCIAVVAAYRPLGEVAADALLARPWPSGVASLIDQQVRSPRAEASCRAAIPKLTDVDELSRPVQDQYEANPYPRWISAGRVRSYPSVDVLMQRQFPLAPFRPLGKQNLDILVAGCGTGQQAITVARQFEQARLLAIDLSATSLGYALARTRELGITTIEYAQADILRLGGIERSFDLIYCGGVLHHMVDPWAGWRVLLSLLRPNGLMHIALYSEIARRDVVAARAFIAARGYRPTVADIRACRAEVMNQEMGSALRRVTGFIDFASTSECRDLLFHVQEHRMTLPSIATFLDENRLRLLGFELDLRVKQKYGARFPADRAMIDLAQWDAFERDHPETFISMYQFWVQQQG